MKSSAKNLIAENSAAQVKLAAAVVSLDPKTASTIVDGEKWSIAHIVEHIAIVEEGIGKLCSVLLKKAQAEDVPAANGIELSDKFLEAANASLTVKLSAPETVHPSIDPQPVAESIERLAESGRRIEKLAPMFDRFNSALHTYPHPHWGDLTAGEWLSILGPHKLRHIKQIQNVLNKI